MTVAVSASFAETVTLAWDKNRETDLAGYIVYYGAASLDYSFSMDVGNTTQYNIQNLDQGVTYYFAVSAYDEDGNESDLSVELPHTIGVKDSDSDGVPDDQDDFPFDPNETIDSDGDGVGNNADTDDDDDGMPDSWELAYGLDPLYNDAADDLDGDGVSNIVEHQLGTKPNSYDGNYKPDPPMLLTPSGHEIVTVTPMLSTGDFYDANINDIHSKTRWKIVRSKDGLCVFDVTTESSLTRLAMPRLFLDENTDFIWRVRFFDQLGAPSDWSEAGFFRTDFIEQDSDGNGILDHQEIDDSVDIDGDDIPDKDQDGIKCVKVEGKTTQLCLGINTSETIQLIASLESESLAEAPNVPHFIAKPHDLPYSLISYKLILNDPGAEAIITLYLSQPAPVEGKWYKYDPINATWQDYSEFTEFGEDHKSVVLTLVDGGIGDADNIENGIIVDPLAFSVPTSTASPVLPGESAGSSSGSGCFIASTTDDLTSNGPVGVMCEFGPWLALILFSAIRFNMLIRNNVPICS